MTKNFSTTDTAGEIAAAPDFSWRSLYRVGSVSAAFYVALVIVPLVLLVVAPQPPLVGGAAALEYIASHKLVYIVELVAFVGLSLPAIVVFLALYAVLKHLNKSAAALGAVIGIVSETIALALGSSPPSLNSGLVSLSDHYMAASTDVQRATFAAAAESLMATSNAVTAAGILTALGILLLSLVMLKGIFHKGVALLGIITGILGIICEAFREIIGPVYIVYGLLLPTWFLLMSWKLYRLSRT